MGLFDFLKGGGGIKKHADRVANKHTQANDRADAIFALRDARTAEAVEALMVRFTYRCDPSITDQEEKETVLQAVVEIATTAEGTEREDALGKVKDALKNQDSIAGPMKCLNALLSDAEAVGALLELLRPMHTDYERDPAKKTDVIAALEDRKDSRVVEAVTRFIEDMNETVRFHAVSTLFAQDEVESAKLKLEDHFVQEESGRVRALILDHFIAHEWTVEGRQDEMKPQLPHGYSIDKKGVLKRA